MAVVGAVWDFRDLVAVILRNPGWEAHPMTNLVAEYLRERDGLPSDWVYVTMKVLDHVGKNPKDWQFVQYEGAVYPHLITRGPRKGQPNFRKPEPGTQRVCVVDQHAFDAWIPSWEERTGKCSKCDGSGQAWAGWSAASGTKFRPCPRCNETGKPPAHLRGTA